MSQAEFPLFSFAPALDVLSPLRKLMQGTPCRHTHEGKIYLGQGQPVMVFPAFGHGPQSTANLRHRLDQAGFSTHDWGLGIDNGPGELDFDRYLRLIEEQVIEVFEAERSSVTLLGWSLSGIYTREVAKRTNPLVRQVITLSTPFNTAADPRRECSMLRALEGAQGRMETAVRHRLRQRPPVPCTSIYSTRDTLVPWQLCAENESTICENIQIAVDSHLELADHPKVLEIVTHRLAQPEDEWYPFKI